MEISHSISPDFKWFADKNLSKIILNVRYVTVHEDSEDRKKGDHGGELSTIFR